MSVIRIENNTVRTIVFPGTDSFPQGIVLQPGINSVPQKFWDEYTTYEVMTEERPGKKSVARRPGQEAIDRYCRPCEIWTHEGSRVGPMITIYPEGAIIDRPDGPPPPVNLPSNEKAAEKLIEITTDQSALKRWAKDRRQNISAKVTAKLSSLQG